MTVLVAIIKLASFIREMVLAATFGASAVTDAYNMSFGIVGILGIIFTSFLGNTFIPAYTEAGECGGSEASNRYANSVLHLILIVAAILCVICAVFPDLILSIFAPGFSDEQNALAIPMLRFMSLYLPFSAISNTLANILVSKHKFMGSQLINLPVSLLVITFCFLGAKANPTMLAVAVTGSALMQILLLLPFMRGTGYRYQPLMSLNDDRLKKSLILFFPVILVAASAQINNMVDKILASGLPEGRVASLEFAQRLVGVCQGFIIVPLATVLFPQFTELAAKDDWDTMRSRFFKSVELLLLAVVPITVIAFICGTDVVRIVYERGSFSNTAVLTTSGALTCYILALPFLALSALLYRMFVACQDTTSPAISSFVGLAVNTVASIILVRFMGVGGLALGTSIGSIIAPLILLTLLRKKRGKLGLGRFVSQLSRVAVCALVCGVVTFVCNRFISDVSPFIRFPACTVAGGCVYLLLAHVLSIEAMTYAEKLVFGRLRPKRN